MIALKQAQSNDNDNIVNMCNEKYWSISYFRRLGKLAYNSMQYPGNTWIVMTQAPSNDEAQALHCFFLFRMPC